MVTVDAARRLAMALPEASEEDHHGFPSFRVRGKIYATLPDVSHLNVMLGDEQTAVAVASDPDAYAELWWGKRLAGVQVRLSAASSAPLAALLRIAWHRRAPRALARLHDAVR